MFCTSCGTKNTDSAKFCTQCGNSLAVKAAAPVSNKENTGGGTRSSSPGARRNNPQRQRPGSNQPRGISSSNAAGEKEYAVGKTPIVALILSLLIVGVGQFYNGDIKKGALMLVGAIVLGTVTAGILWLALAIYSAYDAYMVAEGKTPIWK